MPRTTLTHVTEIVIDHEGVAQPKEIEYEVSAVIAAEGDDGLSDLLKIAIIALTMHDSLGLLMKRYPWLAEGIASQQEGGGPFNVAAWLPKDGSEE